MGMLGDSTDEEFGYSVLSLGSGSTNGCYLLLFLQKSLKSCAALTQLPGQTLFVFFCRIW
jgi:hypothetical protein